MTFRDTVLSVVHIPRRRTTRAQFRYEFVMINSTFLVCLSSVYEPYVYHF